MSRQRIPKRNPSLDNRRFILKWEGLSELATASADVATAATAPMRYTGEHGRESPRKRTAMHSAWIDCGEWRFVLQLTDFKIVLWAVIDQDKPTSWAFQTFGDLVTFGDDIKASDPADAQKHALDMIRHEVLGMVEDLFFAGLSRANTK